MSDRPSYLRPSDTRTALAQTLADPGNAKNYEALCHAAQADRNVRLGASAYAYLLICAGGLSKQTLTLFAQTWFVSHSRHFLFYFNALIDKGFDPTNEHLLERRIAASEQLTSPKRKAALRSIVPPLSVNLDSPTILVFGMPKSASSFLSRCIASCLKTRVLSPHNINDDLGVTFDVARFLRVKDQGAILHGHLQANARTLTMLKLFELRPIIVVRDIFDALRSYADHSADLGMPQTLEPNLRIGTRLLF